MKSSVKGGHIVYKLLSLEMLEHQPPTQWRYVRGDERRSGFILFGGFEIAEPEVLETPEVSNQIQELSARAFGSAENEGLKGWREVTKVLLDILYETGQLEPVHPKLLEVLECRKATEGVSVKVFGGEFNATMCGRNAEPLDEGK